MDEIRPEPPFAPEGSPRKGEDDGPVGIFPSWRWLYWTVVVYAFVLVILMQLFTTSMDHSAP